MKLVSLALVLLLIQTSEYPPEPGELIYGQINQIQNPSAMFVLSGATETPQSCAQIIPVLNFKFNGNWTTQECECLPHWCNSGVADACHHLPHGHCNIDYDIGNKKCEKLMKGYYKCLEDLNEGKKCEKDEKKQYNRFLRKCGDNLIALSINNSLFLFLLILLTLVYQIVLLKKSNHQT